MRVDIRAPIDLPALRVMSYDTTVNDAIDPPEARLPARRRAAAGYWMLVVVAASAVMFAVAIGGWLLLR